MAAISLLLAASVPGASKKLILAMIGHFSEINRM
jgi:hypothetical protein